MANMKRIAARGGLRIPGGVVGKPKDVKLSHGDEINVPASYADSLIANGFATAAKGGGRSRKADGPDLEQLSDADLAAEAKKRGVALSDDASRDDLLSALAAKQG